MPAQLDMDFSRPRYPAKPGAKVSGTSSEAAASMRPSAATLRDLCLKMIRRYGDLTADEAAAFCNQSILSIRPRFSELHAMKLIEDSGTRRPNASGRNAVVWKASPAASAGRDQ